MIVVIQCAAKKKPNAGFLAAANGSKIMFVADPGLAPPREGTIFARPDDIGDQGISWRQALIKYNETAANNPLGLLPAWRLYGNRTYEMLLNKYGHERLYILSAGWGLIPAGFLTPAYDITFSGSAEPYKRRRKTDNYDDLKKLPITTTEAIVFLGGKDYVDFFCTLTADVRGARIVYYNSSSPPRAPNCKLRKFVTTTRTNWHYECARALIDEQKDTSPKSGN